MNKMAKLFPEFRAKRVDENVPEGIIRSDYTADGRKLFIEYTHEKGYVVRTRFEQWKCAHLHQAEIVFEVLLYARVEDWKRAVKIAKQIERQSEPYWTHLQGIRWASLSHRVDFIVRRTLQKLEGKKLSRLV